MPRPVHPAAPVLCASMLLAALPIGGAAQPQLPAPVPPPPPAAASAAGHLEVVARVGDRLVHYWRADQAPWGWVGPLDVPGSQGAQGAPAVVQSSFGRKGNFEVVTPWAAGGLAHFWRDNDVGLAWNGPTRFGGGRVDAVALIQSRFGPRGNLELVARVGNRLVHYWREDREPWTWHGPTEVPGSAGVGGAPAMVQSRYGRLGNFEVVSPWAAGGLVHFWRDNDGAGTWHGPYRFGNGAVQAASLVQRDARLARVGTLDVVARTGGRLAHYWRDEQAPWAWHGPLEIAGSAGAAGSPALVQSDFGEAGNFELVTPVAAGGLAHFWRDNDAGDAWHGPYTFGSGAVASSSLLQSSFSSVAGDAISDLRVVADGPGQLILSVAYQVRTWHDDCLAMGAYALAADGTLRTDMAYRPWPIRAGTGRAYLELSKYAGADSSSDKVKITMRACRDTDWASRTFRLRKTWSQIPEDVDPANVRTLSQSPRELELEVPYTLPAAHAVDVRLGVESLSRGRASRAHGYQPSGPLAPGEDRTARVKLVFAEPGTDASGALLLTLYESGGSGFAYALVPRAKYWASDARDSDGDGIADANEREIATDPGSKDSDGDGLEDGWELEGYRDGRLQWFDSNLPFLGADPRRRDVFVEVDYLATDGHFAEDATFAIVPLQPDGRVLLRSKRFPDRYVAAVGDVVALRALDPYSLLGAVFRKVPGLADGNHASFESVERPGAYLRHRDLELRLEPANGTQLFRADATFLVVAGLADATLASFVPWNYQDLYLRQDQFGLYVRRGDHDHRLPPDSIAKAKEVYAGMPIANPDGTSGVTLHVLNDQAIPYDGDLGGVCGTNDYLDFFPERKRRLYHWAIAGHGGGGQSWVVSNRLVFGTGDGNPAGGSASGGDRFGAYATFVHELGHNLGLLHEGTAGDSQSNCKPNYPSLMNYAYDYSFDCSPSSLAETRIRYSAGECAELSEVALSETQNPLSLETVRGYDADTLSCNALRVARSGVLLQIDWNRNGVYDPGPVQVDFSGATRSCAADGQFQSHQRDSNDFQTIAQSLAAAIRSPFTSNCAGVAADTGYLHATDTPNFQPVCGLPPVRDLREHPWLRVNPVFRLRPGLLVEHPALRHQLAPVLTPDFRIRPEAPIQAAPLPTPDAFRAPPVRLEPAGPASERSLRGRLAPASR